MNDIDINRYFSFGKPIPSLNESSENTKQMIKTESFKKVDNNLNEQENKK